VRSPKFDGKCDSLKGFVFDCVNGQQSYSYNVAIKEVAEYVGRDYVYGGDVHWTIENKKRFKVPMPADISTDASATNKRVWECRVDEFVKHDNCLTANLETAFSLVMGQCTEFIRTKLDALKDWKGIKDSFDLIRMIKATKGLAYQFEGQKYYAMALHQAKKSFFCLYQGRDTSDAHYLDKFMTRVSVVEQYGGWIGKDDGAIQDELGWAGLGWCDCDFRRHP
jgi:hypothetical protein